MTTTHPAETMTEQLGEYATLANGFWELYVNEENQAHRKYLRERWVGWSKMRLIADMNLLRLMQHEELVKVVSEHFAATLVDGGISLRKRESNEVIA